MNSGLGSSVFSPAELLQEFKKEFSDRRGIHFNSAGLAPTCRSSSLRAISTITRLQNEGSFVDSEFVPELRDCRARLAEFLGASASEVAYVPNCATAISQVALGYPLSESDEVVTLDQEYSSNFYPWKVACDRSRAKLNVVRSELNLQVSMEKLIAAIKPGVRLVGVSWVEFQTGTVLDLVALGNHCRSVGAFLVVDAIQGLGQLPFSFRDLPVDFVCGGSHKWIGSLNGLCFFAVKKPLMDLLAPTIVGCGTFNRFGTYADPNSAMETSARKFEPGGLNYVSTFALDAAVQSQLRCGPVLADEIFRLNRKFRSGLLEMGIDLASPLEQRSGTSSFRLPADKEVKLLQQCKEEQVMMVKRGEFVRASIHGFCEDEEVERVCFLLKSLV
jgi:cysteine desulfurase/selenocysteine lyase